MFGLKGIKKIILNNNQRYYRSSSLRRYHSYPDPNEIPIYSEYSLKNEKGINKETKNNLNSQMIQKLSDLKSRLKYEDNSFNNNQINFSEKTL